MYYTYCKFVNIEIPDFRKSRFVALNNNNILFIRESFIVKLFEGISKSVYFYQTHRTTPLLLQYYNTLNVIAAIFYITLL